MIIFAGNFNGHLGRKFVGNFSRNLDANFDGDVDGKFSAHLAGILVGILKENSTGNSMGISAGILVTIFNAATMGMLFVAPVISINWINSIQTCSMFVCAFMVLVGVNMKYKRTNAELKENEKLKKI